MSDARLLVIEGFPGAGKLTTGLAVSWGTFEGVFEKIG
jgi:hypothetical protein